MSYLIAAAVFFTGLHLLVSGTRLRAVLVGHLGENAFRGLFSLASVLGLAALIHAYLQVRTPEVSGLADERLLASAVMLVAAVLVVLGVSSRGPTAVGGEKLLDADEPARGIHRVTRHPMLWGFTLWAAVHMLFNPDAASLIFFGAFLVTAAAGTLSIDAKRQRMFSERWSRYLGFTSNLPFLAILQGRNRFVAGEFSLLPLLIAVALFVLIGLFHARLFGMPAY